MKKASRGATEGALSRTHRWEVRTGGIPAKEDLVAHRILHHNACFITSTAAIIAHPYQAAQCLVHFEEHDVRSTTVGVARRTAVQGVEVGAGGCSTHQHIPVARGTQVIRKVIPVTTDHAGFDACAGRIDLQHENVVTGLSLLIEARTRESGTSEKREVRAACETRDVQVAIRPLLHGIRVVIIVSADIRLPHAGARPTHHCGFQVLPYDHFQVSIGRSVEGAQGDLVGCSDHSCYHIDGTIAGVHPNGVSMVVVTAGCVHPCGPAQSDRIDDQGLRLVILAKCETENVVLANGVSRVHLLLASVDTLVNHRGGIRQFAQAGRHHEFALVVHAQPFDTLELDRDVTRITSGLANDVVFQCAVRIRVVPYIRMSVHIGIPHLITCAHVQSGLTTDEVVGGFRMCCATFHAHSRGSVLEAHHPTMTALTPHKWSGRFAIVHILLDAHALFLPFAHRNRVVALHVHPLRCGQGLAQREISAVQDTIGELSLVLCESDPLLELVQELVRSGIMPG